METQARMDAWPPRRRVRRRIAGGQRLVLFGALVALLILFLVGVNSYADWLWFSEVGYQSVYATTLTAQLVLFVLGVALFYAVFVANVVVARRLAHAYERQIVHAEAGIWEYVARVGARMSSQAAAARLLHRGVLLLGLALAAVMGAALSAEWLTVLRALYGAPFGVADPVFGRDVAFFVFALPFYQLLQNWLIGLVILATTGALATYALVLSHELGVSLEQAAYSLTRGIRLHLALLLAALTLLVGATHLLALYGLVYSTRSPAVGAGFADVTYQVPAQYLMLAASLLAAASLVASALAGRVRPAVWGYGLWIGASLVAGLAIPSLLENVEVKPNQLELERPYIEQAIRFTRMAYKLDDVQEEFFPADDAVTAQMIADNPDTVDNIRLWDVRPLKDTLNQIQSIRTYYGFSDVDVDRYVIDGKYREVMLAARELMPEALGQAAPSWVNKRLQFTHGYGLTMTQVSDVAEEGRPRLILGDVPPVGDVPVTRPEIYYGERTRDYVIVRTSEPEFDYPRGDGNVTTTYQGTAGVNVGSFWRKLLYALYFRDPNLLLSSALRQDSAILYRRDIVERVERIAPFLVLDSDPYLVVADGQLWWMIDAYTTSDRFPYSQPLAPGGGAPGLNYIRNSVKITVNAYDGSVGLYQADSQDPLLRAYAAMFPRLLRPLAEMPASLRAHIRYPEDLFRVQAYIFQTFHMQDPRVFYNKEDVWDVPFEKLYGQQEPVDPYYVIMRLPNASHGEFLLMQPFTPRSKDNMIAWLAGRSDGDSYGKLLVYKYPKEKLVYGPLQVEGRIDQDPQISAQFTLWSTAGSQVIRGNLLVIPIGTSNLYVEPIYLQAQNGRIPELKRVVVSTGSRVVMEPSLREALASLYRDQPAAERGATTAPQAVLTSGSTDVAALAREARAHYERAQEALKAGDWARYGQEQQALGDVLRQLDQATHAP